MAADASPPAAGKGRYQSYIGEALELAQVTIYLVVGLFLIILTVVAFLVAAGDLAQIMKQPASILIVDNVLEDIMIVFIITGLIQTLIVYIKRHSVDPWLVLSVGVTAVVRRILAMGAEHATWDNMLATAALLLVIIVGLYLVARSRSWLPSAEGGMPPGR